MPQSWTEQSRALIVSQSVSQSAAAAAKAAAAKTKYHRDNILAASPDNRFAPFAVEEGGRLGTDAEALVDAIVRAGSSDPTTWLPTKTYCMRALAATTVRGVRVQ